MGNRYRVEFRPRESRPQRRAGSRKENPLWPHRAENIAIMTGIEDAETDELIRYYRKDFRKTQDNIRNLLKSKVWS